MRNIERSTGYEKAGWKALIATMIDLEGSEQLETITSYLAENFPPNDRRQAKRVDGNATIKFKEWVVPTLGQRARDPIEASDVQIWFVNSTLGRLGRLSPRTGAVKEWPSPSGPRSHPHAIAIVNDIVWYNESGVRPDMLVRFDPRSETFQSWPIPSGEIYSGILRHLDVTRDGNLLIHQSATNRIIHVTLPPAGT